MQSCDLTPYDFSVWGIMANVSYQKPKDTKDPWAFTEIEFKVYEDKVSLQRKGSYSIIENYCWNSPMSRCFFFYLVILTMATNAEKCSLIYKIIILVVVIDDIFLYLYISQKCCSLDRLLIKSDSAFKKVKTNIIVHFGPWIN